MFDLARKLVKTAVDMGAQYAEARVVDQLQQVITGANGKVHVAEVGSNGLGIRVLVDGHWGFAGDNIGASQDAARIVRRAVDLARAMPGRSRKVTLAPSPVVCTKWETPRSEDAFAVPVREKVELLESSMAAMAEASDKVSRTRSKIDVRRETTFLVTSEGTEIEQTLHMWGALLAVVVADRAQVHQRSFPCRHGDYGTGGYEAVRALNFRDQAPQLVREAVELLAVPICRPQTTSVILDSTMLGMLIHETLGHAIELDRALGDEVDNFGTSFLRVHHRGKLRYGSDIVTIVADATRPGAVATYGFDHEGVPAQRIPIIERGIFSNYLTSRESAHSLGMLSNGTSRAVGWNRIPMVRITNLCLVPGDKTLDQLISETDEGLYIDSFKGADIDDKRLSFSFMGERGHQIRSGRIVGMVRNPVVFGETTDIWQNCSGIAGPDEDYAPGIAACGKGLPWQHAPTGQGGPPARFERVKVGSV